MESERRNTKCYKFPNQAFHDLRSLAFLTSEPDYFKARYGRLLSLLNIEILEGLLSTLVQFYDPMYHCFTFPDYQLVPTIEEYSFCTGIPVSDIVPFSRPDELIQKQQIAETLRIRLADIPITVKGNIEGIAAEFLQDQAIRFSKIGCIDGHHAHLALLIYGLILFPNIENFVDMTLRQIREKRTLILAYNSTLKRPLKWRWHR